MKGTKEKMETEDVARNTVDNLGGSEPFNLAGAGRSDILDSGQVGSADEGKTFLEEAENEESGLGATSIVVSEGGDEKREEGGSIVQCTVETVEVSTDAILVSFASEQLYWSFNLFPFSIHLTIAVF